MGRRPEEERTVYKLGTKSCRTCCEVKPLGDFYTAKKGLGGRRLDCKPCQKILNRKYKRDTNSPSAQRAKLKWRENNRDRFNAMCSKSRAKRIKRTPKWFSELDDFVVKEAYELARLRKDTTGIDHHVDHILPLLGKRVSGLHVWNNIQVITETENWKKHNKFDVGDSL